MKSVDYLQKGFTLLELAVVLLVLVVLAGLAMPYIGGTGRMAMCRATDATLQTVKQAIMGGAVGSGSYCIFWLNLNTYSDPI
ncbi:MAG: hypothetical protein CVV06_18465 [Gammaproteobacteria bacterium HGW-Gammaproteobacteria-10]|nr:MAG: hypothetical protein CVV13_14920 [Gammaproteobacteria bacterium HGW-Gammaproteobacteria-3]PKM35025.1 MAG: hypothetical protein CVV06_18465 [Gammaproteobacteria bacterium HGW-Gammaproteobacteria-10]